MSSMSEKMSHRTSMEGMVHKAYKVMLHTVNPKFISDEKIPLAILKNAKGIAFITRIRAGFVFAGELGGGIVIARTKDGTWSGPSSVGVAGMSWGALIGAESTDSVIILNTDEAVKVFSGKGQVKLGADIGIAVGPVGREAAAAANAGSKGVAACFSYSHSRGLFAGLSLSGVVIGAREKENARFYGTKISVPDILAGKVKPPELDDLKKLYQMLAIVDNSESDAYSYRPEGMSTFRDSDFGTFHGHPKGSIDDDDDSHANISSMGSHPSIPKEAVQDLEPGWVAVPDSNGEVYYWNERLNITQWEKPVAKPRVPLPPPVASAPPPLPVRQTQTAAAIDTSQFAKADKYDSIPVASAAYEAPPLPPRQSQKTMTDYTPPPLPSRQTVASQVPPATTATYSTYAPAVNAAADFAIKYPDTTQRIVTSAANEYAKNNNMDNEMADATQLLSSNMSQMNLASSIAAQAALKRTQMPAPTSDASQLTKTPSQRPAPPAMPTIPARPVSTRQINQSPSAPSIPTKPVPTAAPAPVPATTDVTTEPPIPLSPPSRRYSIDEVREKDFVKKEHLDPTQLEDYLLDDDFEKTFKMTRDDFKILPKWKRDALKKSAGIF